MIQYLFAYILGGFTFIPLTLFVTYCTYSIFTSFFDMNNSSLTQENNKNDDMRSSSSSSVYKVGWLKVTKEDTETSQGNTATIGDMIIHYISNLTNNKKEEDDYYFSVLKHNTLYLYDSEKQLDCKHVINLSQFNSIQMHPPGLQDSELFSKPNTIHLKDASSTSYYINCSQCIDKEDWYFSLIRASNKHATPVAFDQTAMNHMIKMIYSDERHFQNQWFNAILGRIFFGIYKTQDIKDVLYKKVLTKLDKINSKRPPFLGEIAVRSVDPGHALPLFTQPKLLNMSPTGELTAEVMMEYDGGFRLEIETELKWQYSDRLKPITIDLVLGVTLKAMTGKLLVKIKEPPTNRLWYGFYECPKMEWKVEPLVYEKRIGYSVVTKAIESKIQEFIMETMVLPHFDDITFFPTANGGLFMEPKKDRQKEDEDLLSIAKSLPELISSAVSTRDSTSSCDSLLDSISDDDSSLLGSPPSSIIITPSISTSILLKNIHTTYLHDDCSNTVPLSFSR